VLAVLLQGAGQRFAMTLWRKYDPDVSIAVRALFYLQNAATAIDYKKFREFI